MRVEPCRWLLHRQSGVWHEAGFVDFGLASCSREFPRLRARNAPTWPSEAQCTKPEVLYSLNSYSPAWVRAFPNFLEKTKHDEWVRAPYKWEKRGFITSIDYGGPNFL